MITGGIGRERSAAMNGLLAVKSSRFLYCCPHLYDDHGNPVSPAHTVSTAATLPTLNRSSVRVRDATRRLGTSFFILWHKKRGRIWRKKWNSFPFYFKSSVFVCLKKWGGVGINGACSLVVPLQWRYEQNGDLTSNHYCPLTIAYNH